MDDVQRDHGQPVPPVDLHARLCDVIDPEWVARWWNAPVPALGGRTPAAAGDRRAVERLIASLEAPGAV